MHDWTKVESGIYHAFHGPWLQAIARALNNGLLPPTYYALGEQVTVGWIADIVTLHTPPRNGQPPQSRNGASVATLAPPSVAVLDRREWRTRRRSGRRVAIRHVSNHRVVAVIELVSPGNREARFVKKIVDLLREGVHVFVIDPFPPPAHHPDGLHAEVWRRATKRRKGRPVFTSPPERPLLTASYWSGPNVLAAVQPFAVGESVPSMPLYLGTNEEYVTVPLETTYAAAWPDMPKIWRDVLEA
jgi:hypothetical protein